MKSIYTPCIGINTRTEWHTHAFVRLHVHPHVNLYASPQAQPYAYIYIHSFLCQIHLYLRPTHIPMYTHIYAHTHTQAQYLMHALIQLNKFLSKQSDLVAVNWLLLSWHAIRRGAALLNSVGVICFRRLWRGSCTCSIYGHRGMCSCISIFIHRNIHMYGKSYLLCMLFSMHT